MEPSSGGFVRCTSTSSLDDICQANKHSELTCSLVEPDSNPAAQPKTESCSSEAPRFCDCTAFCNSASQFFAIRININSVSVDINILKGLLSELNAIRTCFAMSGSECRDILKHYKRAHLECHGTQQRLYSCMVILEMSGPVNGCSLNKLLQQVITSRSGITNERPLTRMVVCGAPGLALRTLLASNLTWVASDLLTSDVCQPDPTLLKCEVNESLAVLLTDTCPPEPSTTMQSTRQPSTLTNSNITTTPEALTPSVTNTTEETYTTAENTATVQQTNASQETAQPNMTTPLITVDSTQSSTTQPVLQTSSQNMTVTVSDSTTAQNTTLSDNTTLLTPRGNTKLQNTTTAPQNTTEFITLSPVNSTLQMTTAAPIDSTLNTTALSPNYTTVETVSPSHNHTTVHNVNNVTTVTPSNNNTMVNNVTTVSPSNNHTTAHNVTTVPPSDNHTVVNNVTTVSPSNNHTTAHNVTTITPSTNHTTAHNVTTITPSTNHTTAHNVTTVPPSDNHTVVNNVTTVSPSNNHTTVHNVTANNHTTASNIYTTEYNVTTANNNRMLRNGSVTINTTVGTVTPSPNHTEVYNVTTAANNFTTVDNVTTADRNRNLNNGTITTNNATISTFTPSPNHTLVDNVTAVSNNHTNNITTTTVHQNKTATDNVTAAPTRETQQNTTVPYKNMTSTTARQVNVTLNNATTSTKNTTVDNVTPVVNNTTEPTVTPLNNQTGNHTTVGVTHNITTANGNDNFTTATTVVSATSNLNQTTGISFNLSTTTSSSTTNVNLTTKGPGVNLTTTTANVNATSPTTSTTMHGTTSAQINTTTLLTTIAKPSLNSSTTTLQTTTTDTTTTKSGTETTPTTTIETTTSQGAQEEQADELLSQTQDASQFNSSQVAQVVGNLEKLLDGPTVSQSVGQKAATVISNLLEGDSLALSASAKRLIHLVDDLGLKLVVTGDRAVLSAGSLVLAVRTVDGTNFPTTSVDIFNTDNIQLRALGRSRSKRSGSALGSVVLPSSLTTGLSPEQQRQASRVQFTFYTKSAFFQDAALDNQTIVSPVLAASVANLSISNLKENIQFTIRSINPTDANATCAFWDFTQNGGNGGWSSAGCFVVNATQEETTCSCNHLTSFAILLDLSRGGIIDRQHAQILTFITYIGCGISAIFLAVTLLTYLAFPKLLRDIPAKILVQLCVSLLFLNLVFLLDGWLALYPAVGLCISTAFFLHYFLLTSFTWAGLEALHMYLSIVQVFTPYLSRYMLKFSLVGWGIPLIIVIIVIAVDKDNYGVVTYGRYTDGTSDDFCWLRNDIAFYVGVVAYFLLIFALCLVVFIIVMVQLSRIKKQNPQNQPPNRSVMTDLRSIAGLIILLGLTWGFALFAWGPLYIPFVYLFSIFNSLQGFLVFVFHCAVKENVRRQWRTYLCCGRLRLAENSEWSRTATQNNRNLSVTTATTSAPHFTSRSASVISDATNSSGSVFADSGISDGSNSDTVLNDIHRRNLSL
ncbi:adhesion G-protein coupled receptor G2 [Epinephelus moara]|uniref:adhesion G-protein coupled receptor G2 n=1 Tax=Epinephelus moara TaxID=300413 RepID=UPI00214F5906|nr:adhesion G-protein coupled receptor G2 [Epinephelus moara]